MRRGVWHATQPLRPIGRAHVFSCFAEASQSRFVSKTSQPSRDKSINFGLPQESIAAFKAKPNLKDATTILRAIQEVIRVSTSRTGKERIIQCCDEIEKSITLPVRLQRLLIEIFLKLGKLDAAVLRVPMLHAKDMQGGVIKKSVMRNVWNPLIAALTKTGRQGATDAVKVYKMLGEQGFSPDAFTVTYLIGYLDLYT